MKSVTPYVDGAKGAQPVTLVQKNGKGEEPKWGDRIRPPDSMEGYRKHVHIGGSGIHFVIGEYGNRKPGDSPADFFVEFGSSGSAYSAIYESWAKEASWNRQRGEPLAEFVTHNLGATGTIRGMTDHPHIKTCSSIEDFLAKMVMLEYLGDTSKCDVLPTPKEMEDLRCNVLAKRRRRQHYDSRIKRIDSIMRDGEVTEIFPLYEDETPEGEIKIGSTFCVECGHVTELSGANCRKCTNCGNSSGCG